ncbi:MAG: HigA family addiction module antitoxin [Rubrobacteraceae bacterium]
MNDERIYPPIHPGELLSEEFMEPMGITPYALAKGLGVDQMRVHKIVKGERSITADTALRLSRYFGMSEECWINAQSHYDLEMTKMERGEEIARAVKPLAG